jgi:hypothetical protein
MSKDDEKRTDDQLDMVRLRSDCMHLSVQVLSYMAEPVIDPGQAINVAESYLRWILNVYDGGVPDPVGIAGQIDRARRGTDGPSDLVN